MMLDILGIALIKIVGIVLLASVVFAGVLSLFRLLFEK
jgi:hypothetical protein